MAPEVRIARPVGDLERAVAMYTQALELAELGHFRDHAGFDGAMLGRAGQGFHFEFVHCRTHPVRPTPTVEDLLVFYVPEPGEWERRCRAMLAAGFVEVPAFNPYWAERGRSFRDPDGYTVVIERAAWKTP